MVTPKEKAALATLIAKVRDLVSKKPEKAAILLTNWVKATPPRDRKLPRKKAA